MLLATAGPNIGNTLLVKKPAYRVEDFAYVAIAADNPMVLIVNPSIPAKTPGEFVDYVKARPGKVNWASAGVNSTPHISMAIFEAATGVKLAHVPYKGGAPAMIDVVSGQVAGILTSVATAETQIRTGRVRVIGVAGRNASRRFPTCRRSRKSASRMRIPNFYGMAAPARTPPAIVRKLNAGVNDALAQPDVPTVSPISGMDIVGGSPEDATKYATTRTGGPGVDPRPAYRRRR